jgi:hypothetical protein
MSQNGLGLNNVLYMAVLLAGLTYEPESELHLLLVEEPEAHLHPQMQDLLMRFLQAEVDERDDVQVVVTTHSPNFASAARVERITSMSRRLGRGRAVGDRMVDAVLLHRLFVMVGALEQTGAIGEIADGIATLTGGDRTAELLGITWISAIASGVVDNIPFTATMIPVVEQLQGGAGDDAYWWALALGACFGGNFTLVAAAANVAAAGMAERSGRPIRFVEFLKVGVPATLVSLVLATAYILLRYT